MQLPFSRTVSRSTPRESRDIILGHIIVVLRSRTENETK
jgi:hypothetical protein